jgi:hypothetical protein
MVCPKQTRKQKLLVGWHPSETKPGEAAPMRHGRRRCYAWRTARTRARPLAFVKLPCPGGELQRAALASLVRYAKCDSPGGFCYAAL